MSTDEKNEGTGVGSRAEGAGGLRPEGAISPSSPHAKGETYRIGTKDDIRAAGGAEGGNAPKPRITLRDGTK